MARQTGYQSALNEILSKAAAEGTDFIAVDENNAPAYWTVSEVVGASAYKRSQ
jgi:hypothetical protein